MKVTFQMEGDEMVVKVDGVLWFGPRAICELLCTLETEVVVPKDQENRIRRRFVRLCPVGFPERVVFCPPMDGG